MKTNVISCLSSLATLILLAATGCSTSTDYRHTSPYHPGPTVGRGVGEGAGVVAGNALGAVVGVGEGLAAGVSAPFDPTTRVVRRWRTETTSDGRTVQVPEDILVDQYGRPYPQKK